jgi:TolB-like protein
MDRTLPPSIYEFGEFRLDIAQQQLSRASGEPAPLSSRAFELLSYFAQHPGELLEKSALMKALWPNVVVEENNLSQHLSTLRRVLGDGRRGRRYIVTVPGRGYRFVADVRHAVAAAAADASTSSATPAPPASVAVLPFANLSGDPEKDYFGDGVAEELIYLLSRVPGLKVPARTSSFAYKGRNLHVREIARSLGVQTVLEGSVRSDGQRIRITVQLISAETGYHLWSASFDRRFEDIFGLQDEISRSIVDSLRERLDAPIEPPSAPLPPTRHMPAYELFLRGNSLAQLGGYENATRGIELLEKAIGQDPQFARALASIATWRASLIFFGRPEELARSKRDAEQALAIDPALPEARSALGLVNLARREWLEAEANFRTSLSLPHGDKTALGYFFAVFLHASAGHSRKVLEILHSEYRAGPANRWVIMFLAAASLASPLRANATQDAARYARLAVDLGTPPQAGPLPAVFSYTALREGNPADVAIAAENLVGRVRPALMALGGADVIREVHTCLANPRSEPSALPALERLALAARPEDFGPEFGVHVVAWLTMLGSLDSAYALANRMLDFAIRLDTVGFFTNWLWTPELLPFRRDERFQAFVQRLDLRKYWLTHGPPDDCEIRDGRLICL